MFGRIMKGISGFYFVYEEGSGMFTCKAKGIFRKKGIKPLVGDFVEFSVTDEKDKEGNITEIKERKNELIRPAVSNVDQALYIMAIKDPVPNTDLLDRFLLMMEYQNINSIICISKTDLKEDDEKINDLKEMYEGAGYPVFLTSKEDKKSTDPLRDILLNKTTVVAGASGVGKSTLTNILSGDERMEIGSISEKIKRGKNTTRHSECVCFKENSYFIDTPGFSSIITPKIKKEELADLFIEFKPYKDECRFYPCAHINEPDCGVKKAVESGLINKSRYDNYALIYNEIKDQKNY